MLPSDSNNNEGAVTVTVRKAKNGYSVLGHGNASFRYRTNHKEYGPAFNVFYVGANSLERVYKSLEGVTKHLEEVFSETEETLDKEFRKAKKALSEG